MITLRGKLTRTLVERKAPPPVLHAASPPPVGAPPPSSSGAPPSSSALSAPSVAEAVAADVGAPIGVAATTIIPPPASVSDAAAATNIASPALAVVGGGDAVPVPQTSTDNTDESTPIPAPATSMPPLAVTTDPSSTTSSIPPPPLTAAPAEPSTTTQELQTKGNANAATSSEEIDSLGLIEQWTWTGIWAFGDLLSEDELNKKQQQENEETKNNKAVVGGGDVKTGDEGQDGIVMGEVPKEVATTTTTEQEQYTTATPAATTTDTTQTATQTTTTEQPKPVVVEAAAAAPVPPPKKKAGRPPRKKRDPPPPPKPRPFTYTWITSAEATNVMIPSSLIVVAAEVDEEEVRKVVATKAAIEESKKQVGGSVKKEEEGVGSAAVVEGEKKTLTESADAADTAGDAAMTEATADEKKDAPTTAEGETKDGDAIMKDAEGEESRLVEGDTKEDAAKADATANAPSKTEPKPDAPKQSENEPSSKQEPSSKTKTYGQDPFTDASTSHPAGTCPHAGKWEGHFENIVPNTAATRGRKSKNAQAQKPDNRVRERFYLFFNSNPSPTAREVFLDSDTTITANNMLDGKTSTNVDAEKKKKKEGGLEGKALAAEENVPTVLLPEGHIHVRGYGSNRFGTFEIIGSLDPQTGSLVCQRMYVPVPTATQIAKATGVEEVRGSRSSSGRYLSSLDLSYPGEDEEEESKKRGRRESRKRKSTWKKRETDNSFEGYTVGPDGNPILTPGAAAGSGGAPSGTTDIASIVKKRSRLSNESAVSKMSLTPGSAKAPPQDRLSSGKSPGVTVAVPTSAGGSSGATKPAPQFQRTLARTASSGSSKKGSKKKKNKGSNSAESTSATTPATQQKQHKGPPGTMPMPPIIVPKLPSAGDPYLARWRAAHYLYYQRVEQEPEPGESSSFATTGNNNAALSAGSSNNSNKLVKVNYVVYEGEMHDGIREGRGICLYNNNTLYEGNWKRNKEHGSGTLMTADRKRIIYEGAWEKGKMHGLGAYYYYVETTDEDGKKEMKENGLYSGSFRQSLRNGHGVYTMPDGALYDGEWRENIQNGYGIFRWADGSIYEGSWRDGKRHGTSGILIASDGFRYEGAWINNAMEGRGVATYPKGQIYDGTWVAGKREGRGTIRFTNGAVYEGRFKDDLMEGQGTMKMSRNVIIPKLTDKNGENESKKKDEKAPADGSEDGKHDWMIPLQFQSDISHIHQKAGFTQIGL